MNTAVQRKACWFLLLLILDSVWAPVALAQERVPLPGTPPEGTIPPGGEGFYRPPELPLFNPETGEVYRPPVVPPEIPLDQQQRGLLSIETPLTDPSAIRSGFVCNNAELTPQERQRLWDETLKKGFVGKNINSGTPTDPNRKTLDQNVILLPDEKNRLALKQALPNQGMAPGELAHILSNYNKGAFAFGLLLPDTLRAGRCVDANQGCALLGQKLQLRNGGAGIVANYKNVFNDMWEMFKPDDESPQPVEGLSQEDADLVRAELIATQDMNQLPLKTAERVKSTIIPNSILTDSFSSSLNSNCTSAACYLNTYSLFDKMFNAYSSGSMLLTSFGPSLFNSAYRAFGYANDRVPLFNMLNLRDTAFSKRLRNWLMQPDGWYFNWLNKRYTRMVRNKPLEFESSMWGTKKVLEGGGFAAWWPNTFKKELQPITDPVRKGEYYRYFSLLKRLSESYRLNRELAEEEFKVVTKGLDVLDPRFLEAKRRYAAAHGKIWRRVDDELGLDIPEWHLNHKSMNWQKYAVKTHTGEYVQPSVDSDFYDIVLAKLENSGHFTFTPQEVAKYREIFESRNGKLLLYSVAPDGQRVTQITRDTLESALAGGTFSNQFARLDDETFVPLTKNNLDYILKKTSGDIQVYRGGYKEARELSADQLTDLILGDRGNKPINSFAKNMNSILGTLRENGWNYRNRWGSLLDRYFAQHNQIIKSYLDPKSGLKLTAYPFAFWGAKRGFNQEGISLYQLPDSWTSMRISHNQGALFNNAFIDFFANDGSDQGDVFVEFLNKLPWKMVLNKLSEQYSPIEEFFKKLTSNELRSTTGNLAIFTSGPQDCEQCGISLETKDFQTISPFFFSPQTLQHFILEDTPPNQKEVGQTLIAYTYHTNLSGQSRDVDTQSGAIDLEDAIRNQETCLDKVKKMNAKVPFVGRFLPEDASVGGALVFGETLGYALFTWGGFLGSTIQQVLLAPELQDCVDTQEGYFVHLFAPAVEDKKSKTKDAGPSLNTTKVAEAIQEGSDRLFGAFTGDTNSWTNQAAEDARQKVNELVKNAQTKDLVEAVLTTNGLTSGQLSGMQLFYLWLQGGSHLTPSSYKTRGKEQISDGNTSVVNDYETGQVLVNNQPVITNPDITRLFSKNLAGPYGEYPNTITKIGLPSDRNTTVLVMDVQGRTMVTEPAVLDCIRQGVLAQTGIPLSTEDLTEAFGLTEAIVTDTHPNIFPQPQLSRIMAEGVPRKLAQGANARVEIQSSAQTLLIPSIDGSADVGRIKSLQFRNGVIIYKPSTNELLVWLKYHEKGILSQNDVAGFRATPTQVTNPLTNCQEPALDLEVQGDPSSEQSLLKAANFNESLRKFGPYQIFDTPTKRFVFYSGPPPGCEPRFKVIDKATGQVLVDQPITSIERTPEGVRVTTADGKTHDLGFSEEGGKPILTYNGRPEPLLSAQGQKGAFWYDPEKGLWYTENAQLLPLLEAFRTRGMSTQVGSDGKVNSTATGNLLNLNIGGSDSGIFNLPSLPTQPPLLGLFLLSLVGLLFVIHQYTFRNLKLKEEE